MWHNLLSCVPIFVCSETEKGCGEVVILLLVADRLHRAVLLRPCAILPHPPQDKLPICRKVSEENQGQWIETFYSNLTLSKHTSIKLNSSSWTGYRPKILVHQYEEWSGNKGQQNWSSSTRLRSTGRFRYVTSAWQSSALCVFSVPDG